VLSPDFVSLYGQLSSEGEPIAEVVTTHPSVDGFAVSVDGIPFTEKAAAAAAEQAGLPSRAAQAHLYAHQVKPMSNEQIKSRQSRAATAAYEHAGIPVPPAPKLPKNPLFTKYDAKFSAIPKLLQNPAIKGQERISIESIAKGTVEFSEQLLHLSHVERSNDIHAKERFQVNIKEEFQTEFSSTEGTSVQLLIAKYQSEIDRLHLAALHQQAQLVQAIVTYAAIPLDMLKIKSARSSAALDGLTNRQFDADFYSAVVNAPHQPGYIKDDPYAKKEKEKKQVKTTTQTQVSKRHPSSAGSGARNTANSDSDNDDEVNVPDSKQRPRGSRGKGGTKGGNPDGKGSGRQRAASSDPKSANSAKPKFASKAKADGSNGKRKHGGATAASNPTEKSKRRKFDSGGSKS